MCPATTTGAPQRTRKPQVNNWPRQRGSDVRPERARPRMPRFPTGPDASVVRRAAPAPSTYAVADPRGGLVGVTEHQAYVGALDRPSVVRQWAHGHPRRRGSLAGSTPAARTSRAARR